MCGADGCTCVITYVYRHEQVSCAHSSTRAYIWARAHALKLWRLCSRSLDRMVCTSEGRFVFFGRAEGNPAAYLGDAPSPQACPHCNEPVSKELYCEYSKRANIVAHTYFQHFTLPGTVIGYSKHASITYTMCCGAMVSLVKFCC